MKSRIRQSLDNSWKNRGLGCPHQNTKDALRLLEKNNYFSVFEGATKHLLPGIEKKKLTEKFGRNQYLGIARTLWRGKKKI